MKTLSTDRNVPEPIRLSAAEDLRARHRTEAVMDTIAEIKRLYQNATRTTIARDLERAIDAPEVDADRGRARARDGLHGGLSAMRTEWTRREPVRRSQQ